MLFMRNHIPPYFHNQVQPHLNSHFHDRIIGQGSQFSWPLHSPDLNPLDYVCAVQ